MSLSKSNSFPNSLHGQGEILASKLPLHLISLVLARVRWVDSVPWCTSHKTALAPSQLSPMPLHSEQSNGRLGKSNWTMNSRPPIPIYSFSRTALRKHHTLCGLKSRKYYLMVLEATSLRSRCWQGWFLLRAVRENVFHASLLAPGGLLVILSIPRLREASPQSLSSCSQGVLSVCMSMSKLPPF